MHFNRSKRSTEIRPHLIILGILFVVGNAAPALAQSPRQNQEAAAEVREHRGNPGRDAQVERRVERAERAEKAREHQEERREEAQNRRNMQPHRRDGETAPPGVAPGDRGPQGPHRVGPPQRPIDADVDADDVEAEHRRRGQQLDREREALRQRRLDRDEELRRMAQPRGAAPAPPELPPEPQP